ncbi:hypothetical protein CYMTET_53818 [Cymbomonas tetramitiformis]|uniref:Myosin motor domain-containing protein n=1 Tax=Cymbomonas tetramitiformis TaxID=36881 RepID=A0AAE0BHD4_9CHLO|nr:hypothetical protein CYMTET_53818 [Cymbomonas tetramitiformis]
MATSPRSSPIGRSQGTALERRAGVAAKQRLNQTREPASTPKAGEKVGRQTTILTSFRGQLDALMLTLHSTRMHFVRCLKPNSAGQAGLLDEKRLISQLHCGGILQLVQLRRTTGFQCRLPYSIIVGMYLVWVEGLDDTMTDKEKALHIIQTNGVMPGEFQAGNTMLFLRRSDVVQALGDKYMEVVQAREATERKRRAEEERLEAERQLEEERARLEEAEAKRQADLAEKKRLEDEQKRCSSSLSQSSGAFSSHL